MEARALYFVAPGRVEVRSTEIPPPGADEILVRTMYSGISAGTEMLAYRGLLDSRTPLDERIAALEGTFEFPFSYGYSCVGRVEETPGSPPVDSLVFAFQPHQDLFTVSASEVIPMSGVSPRTATLFPAVETALQVALDAGDVGDRSVVVLGLGTIGALTAILLARGGADVIGADVSSWRRQLHPEIASCAAEAIEEEVARRTSGEGVSLVVEATGDPAALGTALGLLAHEGTVLVASWYGTRTATLSLGGAFHRRRLTIRSTQVSTMPRHLAHEWSIERRRAVALQLLKELPVERMITHEFRFQDAAEAFATLDRGGEVIGHVALRYDG